MQIITVPCFQDNYSYLVACPETHDAAVIDPPEASLVLESLKHQKLNLVAVLITHHHWDHIDGNRTLKKQFPDLPFYAHHSDEGRVPEQTHFLNDQDPISIGTLEGIALHTPGHTSGSLSYQFGSALFTADTLFSGGCGRLFEGSAFQLYHSINKKIAAFPPETLIYFGHEYTLTNLHFAQHVEPNNPAIQERLDHVLPLRKSGGFSTPSTLEIECATNPFLRCESPEILEHLQSLNPKQDLSPAGVFATLREMKNSF